MKKALQDSNNRVLASQKLKFSMVYQEYTSI
jgi:hypothetical protein